MPPGGCRDFELESQLLAIALIFGAVVWLTRMQALKPDPIAIIRIAEVPAILIELDHDVGLADNVLEVSKHMA